MKNPSVIILLATIFVLAFNATPYLDVHPSIVLLMFVLSPFVVMYMVYVVLRYGKPSKFTFDERWYDDVEQPASII